MENVRWGIISTAKIAREKVIPAIQAADRCEVVSIGSRDDELARRVAADLGIPRAHGPYEGVLADPEVDAVYHPLPNHLDMPELAGTMPRGGRRRGRDVRPHAAAEPPDPRGGVPAGDRAVVGVSAPHLPPRAWNVGRSAG